MDYFIRRYNTPGSAPGTYEPHPVDAGGYQLRLVRFDSDNYSDTETASLEACLAHDHGDEITWIDVAGAPDAELVEALGNRFGLHPLALEDVLHAGQRSKLDDFESHLFAVLNLPAWDERWLEIIQVSLFLGKNFVISFHEDHGDLWAPIRARLTTSPGGRIRSSGPDYLLYTLVDLVVDQAFPILEAYADELEEIDDLLITRPETNQLERIHESRRELVFLRRALWSQRDVTTAMLRPDLQIINDSTQLFLRDCQDHAIHILDMVESYRDLSGALLELNLSNANLRMNDVMRVLTVIATIFMPLSFVVGVYGMNFNPSASPWNMPELNWAYGYPTVLGIILLAVSGMLVLFRRKRWI